MFFFFFFKSDFCEIFNKLSLRIEFYVSTHFLAWAWLSKAKGHSCHTKKSTLAKIFTKKTSKNAKYHRPLRYEKRPVKITMYLGLDIIIKLKFATNVDRCAILNVLNYLTKNFES